LFIDGVVKDKKRW